MNLAELVEAAKTVRQRAHAPYSNFKVGCSINDENGKMFTGCNVENASYGLSLCAERVAVFKALSEGAGKLMQIVVVADTEVLTPPCGACRQILWEFAADAELILENLQGKRETMTIKQILPRPFDASFL